jgi:Flp pilus assembly protein TadG
MVEFALVAPFFFALLFGVIEFSLINSSISAFNFAAKDGARIGSFLGRTDATVDQQICNEIQSRVQGVVFAHMQQIEVFKSDVTGAGPGPADNAYTNFTNCTPTTWPVDSRNDTLADADYLGVRITFLYTYLTGFVAGGNSTLQLTATAIERIEPQEFHEEGRMAPAPPVASVRIATAPAGSRGTTGAAVRTAPDVAWAPSEAVLPSEATHRWNRGGA